MTLTAEHSMEKIGATRAIADHDHDLVHELSKLLDAVWRYDQYIANAEDKEHLQTFWREMKRQDQQNVNRLKELIKKEIDDNCF